MAGGTNEREHGTSLGPGAEFDLIREMVRRWGSRAAGIGDDAALLDVPRGEQLVVSSDVSVDGVHFRREWLSAREIGYRATAAAISDLAAMAASPLGILTTFSVPPHWSSVLPEIADGVGDAVAASGTHVLGGDLSASAGLSIGVTVLGSCARPLLRTGARTGDAVYVTGVLGGPRAALDAWLAGHEPDDVARSRFARPQPRLRGARWLLAAGATAGIDISDGLLGDAGHLAAASGVRLHLDLDRLPVVAGSTPAHAAGSGEEYELLVCAPAGLDVAAFQRTFALPLTGIGEVRPGEPDVVATAGGERVAWGGGYSHF
ncbi:MAG: thiamine-phosphate kinase [Gemmatimonadaceae bacterium]